MQSAIFPARETPPPPRRHCEPPLGGVAIHLAQQNLKQAKHFFLEKEAKTFIRKTDGGTRRHLCIINALP
jgi:hypothetical protein